MKISLNQYDDTRAEITLYISHEKNLVAGKIIKLFARVRKVCNNTEDIDVFFGSWVTKITKHYF